MKTTKCEKCNSEIKNCNFKKHYKTCGIKKKSKLHLYKFINGKYECPHCEKLYSNLGINNHIWRSHGAGKEVKFWGPPWNKGLTKETDNRLKIKGEKYSQKVKNGEITPSQKNKPLTQEVKDKISVSRIKYLQKHPDKVPYLLNHSSKESYPEKLFRIALENESITGWEQEYVNGIYRYDFAFLELKIDVEIDGATHLKDKVKKIDERRDKWSREQGWQVVRFTAKEVKEDVVKCINVLKSFLQ